MQKSTNYKIDLPEGNNVIDVSVLNNNVINLIDKGLILDVGDSTGNANNYVLNLGSITLTSANKGISFKFWADKNSTGVVTINGTYNLVDSNLKPVKNVKAGVPYTVIYDGGTNFFLASGSTVDYISTSVTSDGKYVLEPHTFIGPDGEVHTGTMPNRGTSTNTLTLNGSLTLPSGYYDSIKVTQSITTKGSITPGKSIVQSGDKVYCRMPQGAYFTNASSGYPEISYPQGDVATALGLTADKLVAGNTIGGIAGTATIQSLGGKQKLTKSIALASNQTYRITDIPFTIGTVTMRFRGRRYSDSDVKTFYITTNRDTGKLNETITNNIIMDIMTGDNSLLIRTNDNIQSDTYTLYIYEY